MLGFFMEEMQITPEQFEFACLEGRNTTNMISEPSSSTGMAAHAFSFHQGLFQQIWAANDIRIFIRMMKQRNLELQLQALDLIERRTLQKFETEAVMATKE
jgi:The ARF-like 2 binding protein BART